jgi:hypothetical protein
MNMTRSLLFGFFTVLIFAAGAVSAEARQQKVILADLSGTVEIIPSGKTQGMPASVGYRFSEGDSIKTYDDGSAELFFEKTGVVYIQPSSFLTVRKAEIVGDVIDTESVVKSGAIKSKIRKLASGDSQFKIRTPVAVAAVRGTTYVVRVTLNGHTTVYVLDGEVALTSLLTQLGVTLGAGDSASVDPEGNTSGIKRIRDEGLDTEYIDIDLDKLLGAGGPGVSGRDIQEGAITQKEKEEEHRGGGSPTGPRLVKD